MADVSIPAQVSDSCLLIPDSPARWAAWMTHLRGKRVTVTLSPEVTLHSSSQRAYWWACIVPVFQEIWSLARTQCGLPPYTKDETHGVLVEAILGSEDGPLPGTRVRKRTRTLPTPDYARLIDAARELALHNYGFEIPPPGES